MTRGIIVGILSFAAFAFDDDPLAQQSSKAVVQTRQAPDSPRVKSKSVMLGEPESGRELTDAEREGALQEQIRLWKGLSTYGNSRSKEQDREDLGKIMEIEKRLFKSPTHLLLAMAERLGNLHELHKAPSPSVQQGRVLALALASRCLGDRPPREGAKGNGLEADKDVRRFEQAVEVRSKLLEHDHPLERDHPLVGLTLVDLALAQNDDGRTELAEASLERATAAIKRNPFAVSPLGLSIDPEYHRDMIRLSAGSRDDMEALLRSSTEDFTRRLEEALQYCVEAERFEADGNTAAARSSWLKALGGYQAATGDGFSRAEQTQLAMVGRYRGILDRYLSFVSRGGLPERDAAPRMYFGISNLKGAVYTHLRRIRLERRNPSLWPLFDEYERVIRRLAARASSQDDKGEDRSLFVRKIALEAEMARRHANKMAQMMNQSPSGQLPRGTALVDYIIYEQTPLPDAKVQKASESHVGCFISLPRVKETYLDLGPLAPVAESVEEWRRAILRRAGGQDRGTLRITPEAGPTNVPQRSFQSLQRHVQLHRDHRRQLVGPGRRPRAGAAASQGDRRPDRHGPGNQERQPRRHDPGPPRGEQAPDRQGPGGQSRHQGALSRPQDKRHLLSVPPRLLLGGAALLVPGG
jgi:tetratricopeptide (TPR) repeat protein